MHAHRTVKLRLMACVRVRLSRFTDGVCFNPSRAYREVFDIPQDMVVVGGWKKKRHCLCGDRHWREGAPIPTWGTRTCSDTELAWACTDQAAIRGSST